MSNRRNVIGRIGLTAILLMITLAGSTAAQDGLKAKFDSLFVIASSGELKYRDMTEPAMDSIAAMGADVVPLLIEKFTTKSARERWTIIWIFQRIGSPAVPDLVRALKLEDGLVVQRVCWALGDIKDTASVVPLMEVSGHPRWQVRDQAVEALGKIGDRRGSEVVIAALNDTIGQVRKSAVVSCGQLELNESIRRLVHALGDDFYGARLTAVNSLLKLDTAMVFEAVGDSLNSPAPMVGHLGCRILGEIGGDPALELLLGQVKSPDPERRAHAAEAIIHADPLDNCGFRRVFVPFETDPMVRLRIQSAIYHAEHETAKP